MSDATKLRPEDLNAEERAIVDLSVTHKHLDRAPGKWSDLYELAMSECEGQILARRALFGEPASEKAAKVETMADRIAADLKAGTFRGEQPAPPEPAEDNKTRGLYQKFIVTRTDGRSAPGEKHDGCEYFVLDLTHDRFALPALRTYAEACADEYPWLAEDLLRKCPPPPEPAAPDCPTFSDGTPIFPGRVKPEPAPPEMPEAVRVGTFQLEELLKWADLAEVSLRTGFAPPTFLGMDLPHLLRISVAAVRQQAAQGRKVELGKVREFLTYMGLFYKLPFSGAKHNAGTQGALWQDALAELDAADGKGEGRG